MNCKYNVYQDQYRLIKLLYFKYNSVGDRGRCPFYSPTYSSRPSFWPIWYTDIYKYTGTAEVPILWKTVIIHQVYSNISSDFPLMLSEHLELEEAWLEPFNIKDISSILYIYPWFIVRIIFLCRLLKLIIYLKEVWYVCFPSLNCDDLRFCQ